MADLVVRGGTVVTANGSRLADVAVDGGRISAVEPDLGGPAATAREVVDATGLLVLPGVVDVHTHTRVASDAEPDRFFADSVAAAFGGTTTFLSFNNPGTGSSPEAARSLWPASRVAGGDRRRCRGGRRAEPGRDGRPGGPVAEMPAVIEAGVPTVKAFMVYDFGVDDATLLRALAAAGAHGGMLEVHCENRTILERSPRAIWLPGGSRRGSTRAHARRTSRPRRRHARSRWPRSRGRAAVRRPPVVGRGAGGRARCPGRRPAGVRRDLPALPVPDGRPVRCPAGGGGRFVISPPLRAPAIPTRCGPASPTGSLALVATDHVPDRLAVEKQSWRESFDRISNGGPGIETLLPVVYDEGVAAGRIPVERMVDLLSTTPARLFGLGAKGAIEVGRDADLVLFDPAARRTIRAADLHHSSDYTPYEGREVRGVVRSTIVRGAFVVRDGAFVGRRGHGRFVERELEPMRLGRRSGAGRQARWR